MESNLPRRRQVKKGGGFAQNEERIARKLRREREEKLWPWFSAIWQRGKGRPFGDNQARKNKRNKGKGS